MIALASASVSSTFETSDISLDDCFAALCLVHPAQVDTIPEKTPCMIPKFAVLR